MKPKKLQNEIQKLIKQIIEKLKNMKTKFLMVLVICIAVISFENKTCKGQNTNVIKYKQMPDNSIYAELGGNGILASINYERVLLNENKFYLTGRIGCGPGILGSVFTPVLANGCFQLSNKLYAEAGIGALLAHKTTAAWGDYDSENQYKCIAIPTGSVGIRYQGNSGFLFRAGITPLLGIVPWPGISLGYSF